MNDPTQIKPGDIVRIKEGNYPGVCMVTKVDDSHNGGNTWIFYNPIFRRKQKIGNDRSS